MFNDPQNILNYYEQIKSELLKNRLGYFEASKQLESLDAYLVADIMDELIKALPEDKLMELNNIITHKPDPQIILEKLNLSEADFHKKHEEKLKLTLEKLQNRSLNR